MGFGIYSTVAGANAREVEMQLIANNMANMQTTGYKEMNVSFTSELDKNVPHDEMEMAQALVREGGSQINFAQGPLYTTDNPLDVAIQGEGFFEIQTPEGARYTRNGNFTVNAEGTLVTAAGYPVNTDAGPMQLPPNESRISISSAGVVSARDTQIGKLKVVTFSDKKNLKLTGGNLYSSEGQQVIPLESSDFTSGDTNKLKSYRIAQGHLENSNVDLIRNLTRMIEVARAYEAHQKSMSKQAQASEQLTQIAKGG